MSRDWTYVIKSAFSYLSPWFFLSGLQTRVLDIWNTSFLSNLFILKLSSLILSHLWCHLLQNIPPDHPRAYSTGLSFLWPPIAFSNEATLGAVDRACVVGNGLLSLLSKLAKVASFVHLEMSWKQSLPSHGCSLLEGQWESRWPVHRSKKAARKNSTGC